MRHLFLVLACFLSTPVAAVAEDPVENLETCHDVAERILRPRVDAVEAAQAALAEHDLRSELYAEQQRRLRDAYALTEHLARAAAADQRRELERERAAVAAARAAAEAGEAARAAELRAAAAERRAAGATDQADDLERQADAVDAALAEGRVRFEVEGRSRARSAADWDSWLVGREAAVEKTAASVAAGSYRVVNPALDGKRLTWSSAQGSVAYHEKNLTAAGAGTVRWKLDAVGTKYDRAGIEARLEGALASLAKDRTAIREGSYAVYIDLGYKADRSYVQKLIAEAEFAILDKQNKWAAKEYVHKHPNGTRPSNGSIEREREAAQAVIDDKLAEGDAAAFRLDEWGGDASAAGLKAQLRAAREQGDQDDVALYQELLGQWVEARDAWLADQREDVQRYVDKLALHRELFEEDLRTDREHIDGRLERVLDQTPCGGSAIVDPDPKVVQVRDHQDHLRASSETDRERYRRLDDYDDMVYVGRDGRVHGELRDALANALSDTGVRKPDLVTEGADLLLKVQAHLGEVTALAEGLEWAAEWREARRVVDGFVQGISDLEVGSRGYDKARRALRQDYLAKLQELVSKGVLFEGRIDQVLDSVREAGGTSRRTRDLVQTLERLKVQAMGLGAETLPRMGRMLTSVEGFTGEAAAQWQRFQAAWQAGGDGLTFQPPDWDEMTPFQRGMQGLAFAGAVAQTIQRTSQGMPAPEAIYRSGVDLAIDLAVGGVPVLAAAETATTVLFNGYDYATGQQGAGDATPGNIAKAVAQGVIDKIADGAGYMGHGTVILERWLGDEPGMAEVLAGVDPAKLERALVRVESKLDALAPGHPDEEHYMRMRRTFRQLLRAQASAR